MNQRKSIAATAIPATIRIRQDNGKVRVFRRSELIALLSIPNKPSDMRKEARRMPLTLGYWNYYAEIYRTRYELLMRKYQAFESATRALIERAIIDKKGAEYATEQNVSGVYYQHEGVGEQREAMELAKHRWHIIRTVGDSLRVKEWNLRMLLQRRGDY